jgi:hypothetical protein
MTFPPQPVLNLLLAVAVGQRLTPDADGRLAIALPACDPNAGSGGGSGGVDGGEGEDELVVIPSLEASLTALEERGWVVIDAGGPVVTEKGEYALRRWMEKRYGRGARVKVLGWHKRKVG